MTAAKIPILKISVDFNDGFNQTLEHRIVRPVRQQQYAIGFQRSKLLTVWFKQ